MLKDIFHLRRSIDSIILGKKSLEHLHLSERDWLTLGRYLKVFEIFNIPTVALQGEFYGSNIFTKIKTF
jgi:hypothetical protein